MVDSLVAASQGRPSAVPFVGVIGLALLAVFALVVGLAGYESQRARTLQLRHPGSTVWVVHLARTTRYLLVADEGVAMLRASGQGDHWPLTDVYSAEAALVQFPRSRAKRLGLVLEVGADPMLERHAMVFPKLAGFGASASRAYEASKAIRAARDRTWRPLS